MAREGRPRAPCASTIDRMLLGIDHLVIAVRDPDAAAAALARDAGLAFTGGGRHEAMGTFNRLAFLGDTYLELIGVFDRALVEWSVTFAVGLARWRCSTRAARAWRRGRWRPTTWRATRCACGRQLIDRRAGGGLEDPARRRRGALAHGLPTARPTEPPFLIEHDYAGPSGARRRWRRGRRPATGGRSGPDDGAGLPVPDPAATAGAFGGVIGIESRGFAGRAGRAGSRAAPGHRASRPSSASMASRERRRWISSGSASGGCARRPAEPRLHYCCATPRRRS